MSLSSYQDQLSWIQDQHQTMVDTVIALAHINSGSQNLSGLALMKQALTDLFAVHDTQIESIDLPALDSIDDKGLPFAQRVGQALCAQKHPNAPIQVLLMGHMDTVYALDHPFQECTWLDENTLNGPGVADLKGGLVIMHTALCALERSPWAGKIGWQILINPDEEIGSLSSSKLIIDSASKNDFGLIFEPSLADGTLAGARKGSGNFTAVVTGLAAHAGREHHLGRNAIRALADFTVEIDKLNGQIEGITINPGYIHGGGPVNIVADKALMKYNVRITEPEHERWFIQRLDRIKEDINRRDGIELEIFGVFGRKPKPLSHDTLKLFELIKTTGSDLNTQIRWKDTGGCCDGNNLAAAGLPNVDTLGAVGGAIHSTDEYIKINSLVERAQLVALLLMQLASGEKDWERQMGSSI